MDIWNNGADATNPVGAVLGLLLVVGWACIGISIWLKNRRRP